MTHVCEQVSKLVDTSQEEKVENTIPKESDNVSTLLRKFRLLSKNDATKLFQYAKEYVKRFGKDKLSVSSPAVQLYLCCKHIESCSLNHFAFSSNSQQKMQDVNIHQNEAKLVMDEYLFEGHNFSTFTHWFLLLDVLSFVKDLPCSFNEWNEITQLLQGYSSSLPFQSFRVIKNNMEVTVLNLFLLLLLRKFKKVKQVLRNLLSQLKEKAPPQPTQQQEQERNVPLPILWNIHGYPEDLHHVIDYLYGKVSTWEKKKERITTLEYELLHLRSLIVMPIYNSTTLTTHIKEWNQNASDWAKKLADILFLPLPQEKPAPPLIITKAVVKKRKTAEKKEKQPSSPEKKKKKKEKEEEEEDKELWHWTYVTPKDQVVAYLNGKEIKCKDEKWNQIWIDIKPFLQFMSKDLTNQKNPPCWRRLSFKSHIYNLDQNFFQFLIENQKFLSQPVRGEWRKRYNKLKAKYSMFTSPLHTLFHQLIRVKRKTKKQKSSSSSSFFQKNAILFDQGCLIYRYDDLNTKKKEYWSFVSSVEELL